MEKKYVPNHQADLYDSPSQPMKSPWPQTQWAAARDRLGLRLGHGHRSQRALHGRGRLHGEEAAPGRGDRVDTGRHGMAWDTREEILKSYVRLCPWAPVG